MQIETERQPQDERCPYAGCDCDSPLEPWPLFRPRVTRRLDHRLFHLHRTGIDHSNEAVTPARNGFDVTGIFGRVAQRSSQPVHRHIQTMFEFDKRVCPPKPVPQLFARHQLSGMLQQIMQDLERLTRQPYPNAALEKLSALWIDFKWSESVPVRTRGLAQQVPLQRTQKQSTSKLRALALNDLACDVHVTSK